jgi:hypothetical protein
MAERRLEDFPHGINAIAPGPEKSGGIKGASGGMGWRPERLVKKQICADQVGQSGSEGEMPPSPSKLLLHLTVKPPTGSLF